MWQWVIDFISQPATEAGIHLMVLAIFVMEVWQHWTHHKKNKKKRSEPTYTLDEARIILFNEALNVNRLHDGTVHGVRSLRDVATG